MPKGRRASPAGWSVRLWPSPLRVLLLACAGTGLLAMACQKNDLLKPGSVQTNIVTAYYISSADLAANPIKMDGQALEREWGGPLDHDRPFTQIRMTAEDGSGNPGAVTYLSVKAVYTDNDLFMLVKWSDPQPDLMKDAVFYTGPDLTGREGCQDVLVDDRNWTRSYGGRVWDEDKLFLAFEMQSTGDNSGSFHENGCLSACHQTQSPVFGRPGYGRLDVWEWLACRTNPSRNLFSPTDDANSPRYGTPAYLDDYVADAVSGLVPDPGTFTWRQNWINGQVRPEYVYRPLDDPYFKPGNPSYCPNDFGEKCKVNNGLPYYYIWRERSINWNLLLPIGRCDTLNNAVLPQGQEPRAWRPGDAVGGYFYTYPEGSRADVRGKGLHTLGIWTLEIGRELNTGDAANDIIFSGNPGDEVVFTAAVADNSTVTHWGSAPQILRFGPKPVIRAQSRGQGGAR
jgi:hypothetical protein